MQKVRFLKDVPSIVGTQRKGKQAFFPKDSVAVVTDGDAAGFVAAKQAKRVPKNEEVTDVEDENEVVLPEGDPTDKWTNAQIMVWLKENDVEFSEKATKKELLDLVSPAE